MSPNYEKVFKELKPAGSVVYKTDPNTQLVVSIGTNTIHENKKDEALRSIDIIIANELSPKGNCNTPRIVSSIYSARVIEVGKEKADEEIRIVEQLVNDNKEFQVMCNSLYEEMIESAKKKVKNGKIPGLTDKNGRTLDAHEFAVDVAYAALDRIRVNEDVQDLAVLANQSITGESIDARNTAFAELLKKSYAIESERNEKIANADASEYVNLKNRRALSRGYDLESANTRPTFISEVAKATAKSFDGSGNVFTHNTRISATIILRKPVIRILMEDYQPANHEAGESVKVEESNTESDTATPPAADLPPVEEPKPEGEKKKKADTESGKMLRRLGKIAATITAVALVSKGGSMVKEAIENKQGESSKELSKRLIKWSAMAAYAVPATVIAFKTLNSVKGSIDNADYEQLKKDAWKVALGGMGLYVTRGLVRHFSGVDVFNPDDVTRVARDLGAKFTSKVEKGVKAAEAEEKATAEAPAGEPKSKPKVRILETVRIGLSKTEKSLQVVEDTVDQLKAKIEVVDKIITTLGDGLVIQIPFTDIKLDGSKYLDPVKEVVERVKVVAVGLPKDKQPKDGMRTLGVLGRTDVVVEAVKGRMAELRSVIEAVEAGQNEGPLGFLREILQPFWMTAEEEELMRNAKNAPAAPVEPTTPEETAAPEVELRPAALDDILGLEGLGKVLVNIRDNGANLAELDAFLAANGLRMSAEVFKLLSEGQLKTQLAGLTWDEASQSAVAKA